MVRIIGWGEESTKSGSSLPYWIVANSWNEGWGLNGLFKVHRGSNQCGIEQSVIAAYPYVSRSSG